MTTKVTPYNISCSKSFCWIQIPIHLHLRTRVVTHFCQLDLHLLLFSPNLSTARSRFAVLSFWCSHLRSSCLPAFCSKLYFSLLHKEPITSCEMNTTEILLKRGNNNLPPWRAMTTVRTCSKRKVINDPTKFIHLPELLSTALARRIIAGPLGPAASALHIVTGRTATATLTAAICIVGTPRTIDV